MAKESECIPDLNGLRSEILDLHRAFIEAHIKADVEAVLQDQAESLLFVANGDVHSRTLDETRALMRDYLPSTRFSEYRDVAEPIVGVSQDGSLGWSIVQVKVAGHRKLADGSEREMDFTCAWLTLYERQDGCWKRTAEVSTFK